MATLEEDVVNLLHQKGLTLGAVESATGGLISHLITSVPGCSKYYKGSITAYASEIKTKVVGVQEYTIVKYSVYSPQVVEEMAEGGRKLLGVDVCVADTGIAGPGGGTPQKPVGLFYIGLSHKDGTSSQEHVFQGDREQNKLEAANAALARVKEYLSSLT
jgi:nicotinamide-nucleotide amidase